MTRCPLYNYIQHQVQSMYGTCITLLTLGDTKLYQRVKCIKNRCFSNYISLFDAKGPKS